MSLLRCSVLTCIQHPHYTCDQCGELICPLHMTPLHMEHLCDGCHEFEREKAACDAFEESRAGCPED